MTANTETLNHLAGEKSPYLLQHRANPVDWYPWGEEAFAKAKRENKPIFLSIGYSTCHWCHVMAHESFEDPGIAKILNEHFVSIKVDREERPDVDRMYMAFVQATTGSGGWPMNVWLTPDGKPFFGGTYFPPEDRYGRTSFKNILQRIAEAWKNNREGLITQGTRVVEALQESTRREQEEKFKHDAVPLNAAFRQFSKSFDEAYGGFGGAPKFPRPAVLNFLFRYSVDGKGKSSEEALHMATRTLRAMAEGGMYDHLGGGFHRYSVDKFWHVPHFEKMLYDQGQLAGSYIDAYQITQDVFYANVARDIFRYILRDMTHADGGFFSAEDADSIIEQGKPEHAEGAFYVWSKKEIEDTLGPKDEKIFSLVYGVESAGNAPPESDPQGEFHGKNILIRRHSAAEAAKMLGLSEADISATLDRGKSKLFALRETRPRPHRDDKILTAWNALMISALAKGYRALGDVHYRDAAVRSAEFLWQHLRDKNGKLLRTWREGPGTIEAFAEDYAFLIQASLDLYDATFAPLWIDRALELQKQQDALFLDKNGKNYFSSSEGDPLVPIRMKEDYDGAEPSANSVSAMNLLRLGRILHRNDLEEQGRNIIAATGSLLAEMPTSIPQMLCALDFALHPPAQIVIVGNPANPDTKQMIEAVQHGYFPDYVVLLKSGDNGGKNALSEVLEPFHPIDGKAAFYLCEKFTCQAPRTHIEDIRSTLKKSAVDAL